MQIAQIAPLTEAIPPKLYGGTERVISWLTDELVELGHEVVLFASGDSQTSAHLEACWPKALRLDGSVRDPNALHMAMLERVCQRAHDFDLLHFHLDYYPFSLFSRQSTPFVTTLHGRLAPAGASGCLRDISVYPCNLDLRHSTAAGAERGMDPHEPSRPAGAASNAAVSQARLLCLSRAHFAGKGCRSGNLDSQTLWSAVEDRGQG
jgi:Glycosyltransferase Family 4